MLTYTEQQVAWYLARCPVWGGRYAASGAARGRRDAAGARSREAKGNITGVGAVMVAQRKEGNAMEDASVVYETISAPMAARLFHMTLTAFYEFAIDPSILIREVPERIPLKWREMYLEEDSCRKNPPVRDWEPWHYIPLSKIVYRLEDIANTYELLFETPLKLRKPRIKKDATADAPIDKVTLTIEELIATGKLSRSFTQRLSAHDWIAVRKLVLERDDHTCQYCGKRARTMHVDHIVPVGRGGNDLDNLVTSCPDCNLQKHSRTPGEWLS